MDKIIRLSVSHKRLIRMVNSAKSDIKSVAKEVNFIKLHEHSRINELESKIRNIEEAVHNNTISLRLINESAKEFIKRPEIDSYGMFSPFELFLLLLSGAAGGFLFETVRYIYG